MTEKDGEKQLVPASHLSRPAARSGARPVSQETVFEQQLPLLPGLPADKADLRSTRQTASNGNGQKETGMFLLPISDDLN